MSTIAENLERIKQAKSDIKDAIVAKGGSVSESALLDEYPDAISNIPSGEGKLSDLKFTNNTSSRLNLRIYFNGRAFFNAQYSTDDENWIEYDHDINGITTLDESVDYNILPGNFFHFKWKKSIAKKTGLVFDWKSDCSGNILYNEYKLFDSTTISNFENITLAPYSEINGKLGLFNNSSSILTAPKLPVTNVLYGDYNQMFYSCYNMVTPPPQLPAENIGMCAYYQMFYGCQKLATAPQLPATIMQIQCYREMFYNCFNITETPELPATELVNSCYQSMFSGCKGLKKINKFHAEGSIGNHCTSIFSGCTSLEEMYVTASTPPTIISNMFTNVPTTMKLYVPPASLSAYATASVWSQFVIKPDLPEGTVVTLKSYTPTEVKSWQSAPTITCTMAFDNEGEEVTFDMGITAEIGENTGDEARTVDYTFTFNDTEYTITLTQTANDPETTITVSKPDDVTYGFELTDDGYYTSTNTKIDSSFSYATVDILPQASEVIFDVITYGESNCDYGIMSTVGASLAKSNSADSTNVQWSGISKSSSKVQTVTYTGLTVGETATITVKYRKDVSTSSGTDTFKFKLHEY